MPSQRLIRRQHWLDRLSSYPHDLLISLNESYELLEWDNLSNTLSVPLGIALNVTYMLARLGLRDYSSSYREKDVFEGSKIYDFDVKSGGIHTLVPRFVET
jgi:hypothetical protein